MRLVQPTDFDILEAFSDGKRNTAANIAVEIDKNRDYVNTRLPALTDYGLLERVGPATQSGLYVITGKGMKAVEVRDQYDEVEDFDALLEQ